MKILNVEPFVNNMAQREINVAVKREDKYLNLREIKQSKRRQLLCEKDKNFYVFFS